MRRLLAMLAAVVFGLSAAAALGDENADLNLIPGNLGQAPPAEAPATQVPAGKLDVENSATAWDNRGGLPVPLPPSTTPPTYWQDNLALDGRGKWSAGQNLELNLSDRFNLLAQNNIPAPSDQEYRNDLREAYLTWQPAGQTWLEAGRFNLKNGVALGYNPTDFFKTGAVVERDTADPSVLRENRLGTAMLRGETIQSWGSASLAFAPKFYSPPALNGLPQPSLDPQFQDTNSSSRTLLSVTANGVGDLNPQALVLREDGRTRLGADASETIGRAVVLYGEWAGGDEPDLVARAIQYGKATGTIPALAPYLPPTDAAAHFDNDVAVGGSWTSQNEVTVNLEYHYHQSGMSAADWRNWFNYGAALKPFPGNSEAWYVRQFALFEGEPATRQELFARVDWNDALLSHLELSALAFLDLEGGSSGGQVEADYDLSDAWSVGALAGASFGARRSDYGSLPTAANLLARITRYF